jgi:hypothetical protein
MPSKNKLGQKRSDLDARYGRIGISAVAAAVRYQNACRNPAYAPVAARLTDESIEADEVAA